MPTTTTNPIVLTILNLKGGSGKTTTAAYAAHALHELGARVLGVDADPQGSMLEWNDSAGWPFECVPLPSKMLYRELPGIVGKQWDAVVIDTPPTEHDRSIARAAVRAATHVLIPVAPTPIEFERLRALRSLLDEATDLDAEFDHGVLLVRVVAGAVSTAVYREAMANDGWRVLRPHVPRLERYAQSFGMPVERAAATGYGDAITELLSDGAA